MVSADLQAAIVELGDKAFGLIVEHKGHTMHLTGGPGRYSAATEVYPADVESHTVEGYGETVMEALDACADEAELVEPEEDDALVLDLEEDDDA